MTKKDKKKSTPKKGAEKKNKSKQSVPTPPEPDPPKEKTPVIEIEDDTSPKSKTPAPAEQKSDPPVREEPKRQSPIVIRSESPKRSIPEETTKRAAEVTQETPDSDEESRAEYTADQEEVERKTN